MLSLRASISISQKWRVDLITHFQFISIYFTGLVVEQRSWETCVIYMSICPSVWMELFLKFIHQIFLMFGMWLEIYNPQKLKERTRPKIRLFRHFLKILSFEVFIILNENFCNSWFSIANLVFRKNLFFELCLNMRLTIKLQELLNLKKWLSCEVDFWNVNRQS